ncbi:c-type cytochrome [Spirosoma utsteinense]|uniref:Heme-binding domain-containing protein n=1 Tax=Spirosoma utsteinense TaxID=2585773 RepID=A0ABR6WA23_9BACT|nr:c-type cytochrome [Spirosoma utsteinense]MBC3787000.1 putative heme-binding domain-containing protein [Spirosoma utsteinense]MBC3793419.1 putative heme-binding domain-containing protein [Spirosoma utsteinense]
MFSTVNVAKLGLALSALALIGTSWVGMQGVDTGQPKADDPKVDKLKLLPGFKAEHLYSPSDEKQGSWVAMAFDDKGRMITSDQYGFLYRLELPPVGSGTQKPKVEKLKVGIVQPGDTTVGMGYAQGLLYAFNSLYVMVNNRVNKNFNKPTGLYRLQDTNGDDQFETITLLKELKGQEGEHGPHSMKLSPDGKSIYLVAGNHVDVPQMDAYRLPSNWKEDNLFPQIKDPRGHANDRMAPGGWIAKIDPEGKRWELMGAGFRNAFDIAFNEAGDMFAYDSDMEWDFGLPWYRPTRICHVTSGAEFGWRTGNGKWLPGSPDNLPPLLNIGQGSPTNLMYGDKARFPERYRQSLFAFDWSFGIIYSIRLKPKGSTYEGEREEFISGSPLPLTDGMFGPDGAMYFLAGGRRLESDLYRITYTGTESVTPVAKAPVLTKEHQLRTQLEQYHQGANPAALAAAWPNLNHPDRFVRYAARIAVEHQPVAQWQDRVFAEADPQRLTQAAIALARQGTPAQKSQLLNALVKINYDKLPESQQFDLCRAFELIFLRMGMPEGADKEKVVAFLNPHYPAKTALMNRGLSRVLVAIEAPGVVSKTLALMDIKEEAGSKDLGLETSTASSDLILRNPQYGLDIAKMLEKVPPLQQTFYAVMLSREDTGWTPELRDKYFSWFANAFKYQGGRSYVGFIDKARKLALAHVPKEQVARYDKLSGGELLSKSGNDLATDFAPKGPGRRWEMAAALAAVDSGMAGRNYDTGKKIYAAVLCARCHSMRGEGGDIGPDLTQLGTRFSNKDMLEAIIMPNKTVSDQYASTIFTLKNGQSVLGRLINEDKLSYSISQNPFAADQLRKIPKKDVVSKKNSTESIMLPGLINSLNPDELKDLIAYLKAGGNQENEVYKANAGGSKGK